MTEWGRRDAGVDARENCKDHGGMAAGGGMAGRWHDTEIGVAKPGRVGCIAVAQRGGRRSHRQRKNATCHQETTPCHSLNMGPN